MSSRSSSNFPNFPERLRVGFIRSAHGIRGEIHVTLFAGSADWLDRITEVFLLADGTTTLRTYTLEKARPHKDGLLATFGGLVDRNAAEALKGQQVYIAADRLVSQPGEAIYLREILNFELRDPADHVLGHVVDFSSNGPQDLLVIERPGSKRALVPFIEAFVREIDFDKRFVRVDLPPGLLTLGD